MLKSLWAKIRQVIQKTAEDVDAELCEEAAKDGRKEAQETTQTGAVASQEG